MITWEEILESGKLPGSEIAVFLAADEQVKKLKEEVRILRLQAIGQGIRRLTDEVIEQSHKTKSKVLGDVK